MKGFKIFTILCLANIQLVAKFYSIKSEREMNRKLHDYEYSFVCLASDNAADHRIKDMMRNLSNHDFKDMPHASLAFLFVYADRDSLRLIASQFHYAGQPLFLLYKGHQLFAQSDLGKHYTIGAMRAFIYQHMSAELRDMRMNRGSLSIENREEKGFYWLDRDHSRVEDPYPIYSRNKKGDVYEF